MLLLGAVLPMLTSGCFWVTTKREGEKLQADVAALDTRLARREDDLENKIQQYSSLSYLKRLPIQCLKIDKSFVKDIVHDSESKLS